MPRAARKITSVVRAEIVPMRTTTSFSDRRTASRHEDMNRWAARFSFDEIALLRDLMAEEGLQKVARGIGCSTETLLRVTSGFGDRSKPSSLQKIRKFLGAIQPT
jgi:hypothetical protein